MRKLRCWYLSYHASHSRKKTSTHVLILQYRRKEKGGDFEVGLGPGFARKTYLWYLDDVPDVFDSVTKLAACDTSAQAVIADADSIVLEAVCEIVISFGHRSHKDANTLLWSNVLDVILDTNNVRVKAQGHFTAIGRQVVSDWVLDDFEQFLLRSGGSD